MTKWVMNWQDYLDQSLMQGSIAIVGNGIIKGKGAEIDAHDTVIRFSNAIMIGHENNVGSRESFRFLCYPSAPDKLKDEESLIRGRRIILMAGSYKLWLEGVTKLVNNNVLYMFDPDYWNKLKLRLAEERKIIDHKMPSLGLMAIWTMMLYSKPDLYGFDFFAGDDKNKYHYFEEYPLQYDKNLWHDWDTERRIVEELHNKSKVNWIS